MTWKTLLLSTCLLAGAGPIALAQPGAPEPPQPPADPPPPPETPPQPPRPPQPPAPRVVRDREPEPAPSPAFVRPEGFSVGIGVGYRFPTSLQTPNTTSVRLRLVSGVTLEPTVVFATTSHTTDMGTPNTGSATEFGAGVTARFPVVARRRTDLELLAGIDVDNVTTDPSEDNTDDQRSTTTVALRYGLAVGAWISPHLQASLSATNGLVTYTKNREELGFDAVTVTTDSTFGLIFDPTVVFMLHLYN